VRWCLFCPQRPGDAAAVADLVIACHERDLTLPKKHKRGQGIWRAQLVATSW
jgi:hypothetical protein